jgi:hypothetical protein
MAKRSGIIIALCVLMLWLMPISAHAWGREGHRIIAQIAMKYLTPGTRAKILEALGNTSPEDAATWMDDVKNERSYSYMKPWHYLYVQQGNYYKDGGVDHLIAALNHSYNDLMKNRVKGTARKEALMILFHLVGDLHQPLHIGLPQDEGGELTFVSYAGKPVDLHRIWDTEIITANNITAVDILKSRIPATPGIVNHYRQGDFVRWMKDGRDVLGSIYNFKGQNIDKAYMSRNKLTAQTLLFAAGIRLSLILEIISGNVADSDKFKFGKGTDFVSSGY